MPRYLPVARIVHLMHRERPRGVVMKRNKIFYGYWILGCCFILSLVGSGCGYAAFSFFIKPLETFFCWKRGDIMAGFTVLIIIVALSSPIIGRLIEKYSARQVIFWGTFIMAAGFVLLSRMDRLWQYYLGYTFVGIGSAATGAVTLSFVVSQWFRRKRGQAIGVMSMGMGAAPIVFAPLTGAFLIPRFGWSNAYLVLGVVALVFILPLSIFVLRTRPSEMALFPDGVEPATENEGNFAIDKSISEEDNHTGNLSSRAALKTTAFWFIGLSLVLNHAHLGILLSVVPHLRDMGFSSGVAVSIVSFQSVVTTLSFYFFGWLCDRVKAAYAAAAGLLLLVLAILILINIKPSSPVWLIWLFSLIMGTGVGSWMPTMSMLTISTFGMASYGAIFGLLSIFQNLGGALGPLAAGYVYDITGDFRRAFIVILVPVVLAIPLVLSVKRSHR